MTYPAIFYSRRFIKFIILSDFYNLTGRTLSLSVFYLENVITFIIYLFDRGGCHA